MVDDAACTPTSRGAPTRPVHSERLARAAQVAAELHSTQVRKGTTIPYVSHLFGTCAIALEYGANEDQAIAALLHDSIEDIEPTDQVRASVGKFGLLPKKSNEPPLS